MDFNEIAKDSFQKALNDELKKIFLTFSINMTSAQNNQSKINLAETDLKNGIQFMNKTYQRAFDLAGLKD